MVEIDLTRAANYRKLGKIIQSEYPHENNTCDVSVACDNGLFLFAAHTLMCATETSDELNSAYLLVFSEEDLETERDAMCSLPCWTCPHCKATVYTESAAHCGSCGKLGNVAPPDSDDSDD